MFAKCIKYHFHELEEASSFQLALLTSETDFNTKKLKSLACIESFGTFDTLGS